MADFLDQNKDVLRDRLAQVNKYPVMTERAALSAEISETLLYENAMTILSEWQLYVGKDLGIERFNRDFDLNNPQTEFEITGTKLREKLAKAPENPDLMTEISDELFGVQVEVKDRIERERKILNYIAKAREKIPSAPERTSIMQDGPASKSGLILYMLNCQKELLAMRVEARMKNPEFAKKIGIYSIVSRRYEIVNASFDNAIYDNWLTWVKRMNNDSGFYSMTGLFWNMDIDNEKTLVQNFRAGLLKAVEDNTLDEFWEKNDHFARNYPFKENLEALARMYVCVRSAKENLENGVGISQGINSRDDYQIFEMELAQHSEGVLTLPMISKQYLEFVEYNFAGGRHVEAGMALSVMMQKYLTHKVKGESFHFDKNGNQSLTAVLNNNFLIPKGERPIISAEDFLGTESIIKKHANEIMMLWGKLGSYNVLRGKFIEEYTRLKGIEKAKEMKMSKRDLDDLGEIHGKLGGDFWEKLLKGTKEFTVELADDPATYAMAIVGALTGGVGASAISGLSKSSKYGKFFALLFEGEAITAQVARFIASGVIDAVPWHTGMNVFFHMSKRHDEASWTAGAYFNVACMFGGMKKVGMRSKGRITSLQAKVESGALSGYSKTAAFIRESLRSKAEGALVLSGLAGMETFLVKDEFNVVDFSIGLKRNYQFLVAMSVLHGLFGKYGKLGRFKREVDKRDRKFESEPTDANLAELLKAHVKFAEEMNLVTEREFYAGERKEKPESTKRETTLQKWIDEYREKQRPDPRFSAGMDKPSKISAKRAEHQKRVRERREELLKNLESKIPELIAKLEREMAELDQQTLLERLSTMRDRLNQQLKGVGEGTVEGTKQFAQSMKVKQTIEFLERLIKAVGTDKGLVQQLKEELANAQKYIRTQLLSDMKEFLQEYKGDKELLAIDFATFGLMLPISLFNDGVFLKAFESALYLNIGMKWIKNILGEVQENIGDEIDNPALLFSLEKMWPVYAGILFACLSNVPELVSSWAQYLKGNADVHTASGIPLGSNIWNMGLYATAGVVAGAGIGYKEFGKDMLKKENLFPVMERMVVGLVFAAHAMSYQEMMAKGTPWEQASWVGLGSTLVGLSAYRYVIDKDPKIKSLVENLSVEDRTAMKGELENLEVLLGGREVDVSKLFEIMEVVENNPVLSNGSLKKLKTLVKSMPKEQLHRMYDLLEHNGILKPLCKLLQIEVFPKSALSRPEKIKHMVTIIAGFAAIVLVGNYVLEPGVTGSAEGLNISLELANTTIGAGVSSAPEFFGMLAFLKSMKQIEAIDGASMSNATNIGIALGLLGLKGGGL